MNYKLIFLDVDGTLYSHTTKSIPESTVKALKLAKEKGIKIAIASGRSKIVTAFTGILNMLDFDYFVVTNGNLVIDNAKITNSKSQNLAQSITNIANCTISNSKTYYF